MVCFEDFSDFRLCYFTGIWLLRYQGLRERETAQTPNVFLSAKKQLKNLSMETKTDDLEMEKMCEFL